MLPVLFEGEVKAVIELASFDRFSETHLSFLDQLTESHRHRAQHDRREHAHRGLLKQSQSLTAELQASRRS